MHSIPDAPGWRKSHHEDGFGVVYADELEGEAPLTFLVTCVCGSGGFSEGPIRGIARAVFLGLAIAREHECRFVGINFLRREGRP